MSAAELKELRQEVKEYIDHAENKVVKMVHAMLEADREIDLQSSYKLSPEQESILEERMEEYEKGQMKFSSWEDGKARIRSKGK